MATVNLQTTGTTFVSSLLATNNLSFSTVIVAGTDPIYLDSISFLKFDLSSIPAETVTNATLRLFVIAKKAAPSTVVVNRVTSDFDINAVTYNTRPPYVPTGSSTIVTAGEVLQFIDIDITNLINQWLSGTFPNYGLALTVPGGTTSVQFGGKPIGADFEPRLIVTFTPGTTGALEGIQAQLQGSPASPIADGATVKFDTVLTDHSERISYNAATGVFTLTGVGLYYINWWVATDGSAGPVNMVFAVNADGIPVAIGNSPIVTGQVNGNAFISVDGSPITVTLTNLTGASIMFGNSPIQADLSIFTIS
jgi:hypothetical protein